MYEIGVFFYGNRKMIVSLMIVNIDLLLKKLGYEMI